MAFPEVLTIGATISHRHISFASIPVNLTILIILASPTAMPVDFQEVAPFDFFNYQSH
jgi:hypothetical protein